MLNAHSEKAAKDITGQKNDVNVATVANVTKDATKNKG